MVSEYVSTIKPDESSRKLFIDSHNAIICSIVGISLRQVALLPALSILTNSAPFTWEMTTRPPMLSKDLKDKSFKVKGSVKTKLLGLSTDSVLTNLAWLNTTLHWLSEKNWNTPLNRTVSNLAGGRQRLLVKKFPWIKVGSFSLFPLRMRLVFDFSYWNLSLAFEIM